MTRADDLNPEHDVYLRSALRHAPDAALGPPEALDDAILRRARSATTETSPSEAPRQDIPLPRDPPRADRSPATGRRAGQGARGLAGWWAWLARPSVATGFAGVMVATLVGVMWWGRPLDETMPPRFETPMPAAPAATDRPPAAAANRSDSSTAATRPSPSATGIASSTVSRSVDTPIPATPSREAATPNDSRRNAARAERTDPPMPTAQTAPAQMAKRKVEPSAFPAPVDAAAEPQTRELRAGGPASSARAETDASRARSAGAARESVAPTPSAAAPRSMERFEIAAPRPAASTSAIPPTAAMADTAPHSRGAPPAAAPTDSMALQKSRAAPERLAAQVVPPSAATEPLAAPSAPRDATTRDVAGAVDERKADSGEAVPRSAGAIASNRAGPPTRSPLAPLRATLATDPGRWTWSAEGRPVQRVTPALLAWLARLDAALAARPADSRRPEEVPGSDDTAPAPVVTPTGPMRTLVLLHGGQRHTELRLGETLEVTPIDPPGPRWRALLAAEDAAALRESLP